MSGAWEEDPAIIDGATRSARRFYWIWLVFATSVSVLGNIAHALLVAPDAVRLLAAVASAVPPAFVVGSTHSVALSLRMRQFALIYVLGLLMTIGVAACAFVLSFDALHALAVMLGLPSGTAWLFPIAIDVSIAQATFGLLSPTPAGTWSDAERSIAPEGHTATTSQGRTSGGVRSPSQPTALVTINKGTAPDDRGHQRSPAIQDLAVALPKSLPTGSLPASKRSSTAPSGSHDAAIEMSELVRWKLTADELVRNGTTSKDSETVAAILAEHTAGTPPSTISRRRRVHHSTVGRILAGAANLPS
jgi:hypothetical protein